MRQNWVTGGLMMLLFLPVGNYKYTTEESDTTEEPVNMCHTDGIRKKLNDGCLHIVTDKTVGNFQKCKCNILGGNFSVEISVLKLSSGNGNNCTSAKLTTEHNNYTCREEKGFGAIYGKSEVTSSSMSHISITSPNEVPDTVVVKVCTQDTGIQGNAETSVTCEATPLPALQRDKTQPVLVTHESSVPPKTPSCVDGGWTVWDTWGQCSVTCGIGVKTRFGTCTNPSPDNGGKQCAGDPEETSHCETNVQCSHGNCTLYQVICVILVGVLIVFVACVIVYIRYGKGISAGKKDDPKDLPADDTSDNPGIAERFLPPPDGKDVDLGWRRGVKKSSQKVNDTLTEPGDQEFFNRLIENHTAIQMFREDDF